MWNVSHEISKQMDASLNVSVALLAAGLCLPLGSPGTVRMRGKGTVF
jgi:hypothetical protein